MLVQIEGSQAIAKAVALCRPQVVCAYPITPQTHIVEGVGELVHSGVLKNCEFINVESEFAALSVALGASATGVRTYTATSSQGLLYMMEAVYNVSGLKLPIVMTLGNRAIGSPINIWNDHTDAMSVRDAGWIMLFAEDNQEAVDLHIQAFAIAEETKLPVMVCVDGFILTHAYESIDVPEQAQVDEFLPEFDCAHKLDVDDPCAIGAMVPPETFTEVRAIAHRAQKEALQTIDRYALKFDAIFGRKSGGLLHKYKMEGAETVVVCLGSIAGTIKDAIDELKEEGNDKIGCLTITSYRPFPSDEIRVALMQSKNVIVLEKAFAVGKGGILSDEIKICLGDNANNKVKTVVAGLGGRAIKKADIKRVLTDRDLPEFSFLNLNEDILNSNEI